ncbi:probable transcriptional regulator SLK2 isoform X2 [Impatiens glandulifera]|nr:probable transcriptional regulator SLK2 isoform X2 [Impatiens glandulifera]
MLNSMANSGPSVGASSLVTDANSGLSGGPHLQRSTSFNTDSYMRLPASPISFTSNNLSVSGSSIMDVTSVGQQCSNQEPNNQQVQLIQSQQGATSLSAARMGQLSIPAGSRVPSSLIQDTSMSQMQKKQRMEVKKEDILPQQVRQQLMHRQDTHEPQLQALIQQQALRQHQQQQQLVQSMTSIQRLQFLHQQQQFSLRHQQQFSRQQQQHPIRQQLQQPSTHLSGMKRPFESGVCSNRLMQYLYHQQQRPADNSYAYWKKFVTEYYSPRSKTRWCLSQYDNVGHHSLGVFPQSTMDAWQCEICGSKSGRGFEATFEVLPRLNQIKFNSGVIDELLFLDLPTEVRYPNGVMTLQYEKAVQETVYAQLRVIRKGQLRVLFTPDLKIISWEFCARRHEEFISRKLIAPQVNQLLQVAQKCQNTINESGPEGISQQELQANSNMVLAGGRQLAQTLELQSLNDLGFSKRYVRCLQISEVVNSMKDLMDLCSEKAAGPIDGLKSYLKKPSFTKRQMPTTTDMEQQLSSAPTNSNSSLNPGLNNNSQMANINNNHAAVGRGSLSVGPPPLMTNNYQTMLTRQHSMNQNSNSLQLQQQQQAVLPSMNHNSSGGGGGQRVAVGQAGGNFVNGQRFIPGYNSSPQPINHQQVLSGYHNPSNGTNTTKTGPGPAPSRSNSFKGGPSNSDSNAGSRNTTTTPTTSNNNNNNNKAAEEKEAEAAASDLSNYLNLPDNMFQDFAESGLFDDSLGYSWKS